MLFHERIANWSDWGRVYQSISAFSGVIEAIFVREGLSGWQPILNLTPGTNAVFRAGRYVVKIYAPEESGMDSSNDFTVEQSAILHAQRNAVPAPKLRAWGELYDRYRFRYLVMDYLEGPEAGDWLRSANMEQKRVFVEEMREICRRLHCPADFCTSNTALRNAVENVRWQDFSKQVQNQVRAFQLAQYEDVDSMTTRRDGRGGAVYVHGDLTADNILIVKNRPFVIDFADSTSAPEEYDLPSVLLDLFDFDPALISLWNGDGDAKELACRCFSGIMLHDFGRDYLSKICRKLLCCEPRELTRLEDAERALARHFAARA